MTDTTTSSTSSFDTTLANLGIARTGTTANAAVQAAGASSDTLTQADFLQLLTAQMQNQDPFNPVDNTQMVAQMAQFSQLSATTDMSTTLKAIADKLGATSPSDSMAYIGKTVLTAGNTAYGRSSGGLTGAVQLGGAASDVHVTISDASGAVLHTADLGAQQAGTVSYDWDGTIDGTNTSAGTGPFTVSVTANNAGATVSATNLVWAPVESVSTANGATVLNVPGVGAIDPSAIVQIGD
jgi:flagellar basal-body rod modification protein FlgD